LFLVWTVSYERGTPVGLYLGPCGGPRGGGVFVSLRYPCMHTLPRRERKMLPLATVTSSSLLLSSLELSDTQVYEPYIRALLGTASHFCASSGGGGYGLVLAYGLPKRLQWLQRPSQGGLVLAYGLPIEEARRRARRGACPISRAHSTADSPSKSLPSGSAHEQPHTSEPLGIQRNRVG